MFIPDLHPPSRPEPFQACAIRRQKQFSLERTVLLCSVSPTCRKLTPSHDDWKTGTKWGNDLAKAMSTLVPQGGPVLCRDEMEEWSASEAMLFEEALEKYGKDFNDIRQDFVSE